MNEVFERDDDTGFSVSVTEGSVLTIKQNKSRLIIVDEKILTIETPALCPNCWWRLWQYLLLGFRWQKING